MALQPSNQQHEATTQNRFVFTQNHHQNLTCSLFQLKTTSHLVEPLGILRSLLTKSSFFAEQSLCKRRVSFLRIAEFSRIYLTRFISPTSLESVTLKSTNSRDDTKHSGTCEKDISSIYGKCRF